AAAAIAPATTTAATAATAPTPPSAAAPAPAAAAENPATAQAAESEPAKDDTATGEAAPTRPAPAKKVAASAPKGVRKLHPVKRRVASASSAPSLAAAPASEGPKPAPLAAIQMDAHKEPAAPAKLEGEGTLLVASSPWCNVKVDGVDKGPTPIN